MQVASTSGNAIRRAGLVLGMAWTAASGCATQRGQRAPLSPPPTPAELGLAALALQDSSIGPFFPPERLADNVALRRRVRHQNPVVMPAYASELSWHPSLQFQMADSLFKRLFGVRADPPGGFVNRWLNSPRTGWAAFDSITAALGGAVAIQIEDLPPTYGFLTVYYREPVNIPGVARAYAGLAPAVTISIFQGLIITTNDIVRRPAWSQDSTAPLTTPLRFETAVSRSPIPVGDTATLLFRLRNLGPKPITLRFGSTCQVLPHVARQETGELVYPSGGLPVCGAMVTHLTIPAQGERLIPLQVRGRTGAEAARRQVLAPGDYVAYATLAGPYTVRPDTLAFSVR